MHMDTQSHDGPLHLPLLVLVADAAIPKLLYATDWWQLWGANTDMSNPYQFKEHQLVNIGALYSAKVDETLSALALRFRADIRSLLVVCECGAGSCVRLAFAAEKTL